MARIEQSWEAIQVGGNGNGNGGGITFAIGENKTLNIALTPQIPGISPAPGYGGNSVDGHVARVLAWQTWEQIHDGPGTRMRTSGGTATISIMQTRVSREYEAIYRIIMTFPTQLLSGTVVAATLRLYCTHTFHEPITGHSVAVFESFPIVYNNLEIADYGNLGTIPCSGRLFLYQLPAWGIHPPGFVEFPLNDYGLSKINLGGVTELGLREASYDAPNIEPPWTGRDNQASFAMADSVTKDYRPRLLLEIVNAT